MKSLPAAVILSFLAALTASAADGPVAFPGAEGFGAVATGGRGGEVYHVTNLNDGGAGSFRDAVSKGPRIVVFDVAGYIELQSIVQVASDVTIEGQTAPGMGISTKNYEVSFTGSHNDIVRYIRFREGVTPKQDHKYTVALEQVSKIILDHVSIEFGRWDCIGMSRSSDVTLQNCIIGPGVSPQRFGCLCESPNITFSHNLWISNQSRNPKSKGIVQYINNVVYNYGVDGYVGGHSGVAHSADVINNYFIKGPSSGHTFAGECKATDHIYQAGNYIDDSMDGTLHGRLVQAEDFGKGDDAPTIMPAVQITAPVPVTIDSAEDAFKKVDAGAGCSLIRDTVDTQLISDLNSLGKSGKTIEDPAETGGFGQITGGDPKIKPEGDGIPDAWKTAHGISLTDANAAAGDYNHDGYTNIEKFANSLTGS